MSWTFFELMRTKENSAGKLPAHVEIAKIVESTRATASEEHLTAAQVQRIFRVEMERAFGKGFLDGDEPGAQALRDGLEALDTAPDAEEPTEEPTEADTGATDDE